MNPGSVYYSIGFQHYSKPRSLLKIQIIPMRTNTFTPVKGFEDEYMINKDGIVKSISRTRLNSIGRKYTIKETTMTQFIDRAGYSTVKLTRNKKYGTHYIHRLLALTFIENPNNHPVVNHINGNKLDNSLENLEWTTRSQNHLHALKLGLCKLPVANKTKVIDVCTNTSYPSIMAASKKYNINYELCKKMLKGKKENHTCLRIAS